MPTHVHNTQRLLTNHIPGLHKKIHVPAPIIRLIYNARHSQNLLHINQIPMQVSHSHNLSRERSIFDRLFWVGRGRRAGWEVEERVEGEKGERAKGECSWCGCHRVVCGELAGCGVVALRLLLRRQLGKIGSKVGYVMIVGRSTGSVRCLDRSRGLLRIATHNDSARN